MARGATLVGLGVILAAGPAWAAPPAFPRPWDDLGSRAAAAFANEWTLTALLAGATTTATLSASGADHELRVAYQRGAPLAPEVDHAFVVAGYVAPVLASSAVYAWGALTSDAELAGGGVAMVQAGLVVCAATSLLKTATGRPFPLNGRDPSAPDRLDHPEDARAWSFLEPSRGLAWPSGHTACPLAVSAAISAYYRDKLWVPLVSYPPAVAIAVAMLLGDDHWTSDVVMGALLAQSVGAHIGADARARDDRTARGRAPRVVLAPAPARGGVILTIGGAL